MNVDKKSLSSAIRKFSFWLANGTIDYPSLENISYRENLLDEPSALEKIYAIFVNNLEFNEDGKVINAKHAEKRVGIFIKQYFGGDTSEKLENWENELY